ncbi:zf-RVT domain-containing protein, partial [Cephalotus follicularis]
VCCPKDVGGMGIKDSRAWNRAAIMKIGWDMCRRKDSVWTKWCNVVLLKDYNFWVAPVTRACSWSWRNILQIRKFLIHKVLYEVKNGNTFSLWFDPWFLGASIADLYGMRVIQVSGIPRNAKISSVIRVGRWDWPILRVLTEIINSTAVIHLPTGSDKVHWRRKDDIFSLHEAWMAFIPQYPAVSWTHMAWFPRRIPKHSFCFWLTFRDAHKTLDKLYRVGVV